MDNDFTPENRGKAFGYGADADYALRARQQTINSRVPKAYAANGTNQQVGYSGNGWSASDAARLTIGATAVAGALPSSNGSSARTNEQRRPFQSKLAGLNY